MTDAPPNVFISYSHDTVEHQERVLRLADRLRADGIDAEIDPVAVADEDPRRVLFRQCRSLITSPNMP